MTLRMTWIAHAATIANRGAAFPDDEPIEAKGAAQAAEMGRVLRRPDHAWTSPAQRARQTAEALGLSAAIDPALQDLDHGRWRGRPLAEIHAEDPPALLVWSRDCAAAPHGGESIEDLLHRVGAWIDTHVRDEGHAVVVTHAAVIRCAVLHAIAAPPQSFWRIDVAPLSRMQISHAGDHWRLRSIGRAGESD
jgi:broad specificity phosphatase PhoE